MKNESMKAYLKYTGAAVNDGKMDIEKAGISLSSFGKIFKKYQKIKNKENISIKLCDVKKGSTELNIIIEQILPVANTIAEPTAWYIAAKTIGITEFGKQFFGTLGEQIALRRFSKGKPLKRIKEFAAGGKLYIEIKNIDGKTKNIEREIYYNRRFYNSLGDVVQLETGKEDKMEIGYYDDKNKKQIIAQIDCSEKDLFKSECEEENLNEKLDEDFDESKAKSRMVEGTFVDYYGLAHKYNFSFQARKDQHRVGKQKILCIVEQSNESEAIDYLKPKNRKKNICIFGKAIENNEGKIEKIKILHISKNPDFNPDQMELPEM